MSSVLCAVIFAIGGSLVASLFACVPALHIYNLMAVAMVAAGVLTGPGAAVPPDVLIPLAAGLIVGWAMNNAIPSILLAAPDESALFTVLPGQMYLMGGRGYEAVMLTATGGLLGVMALVVFLGPLAPLLMPTVRMVFRPHYHWILWCVITFMLMAEWPKGGVRGQGGWAKFADAWKSTGAGLLTFLLAGILGFILFHRPPVDVRVAFQNLMPAFVGLFALPWLLLNMVSGVAIPPQRTADALRSDPWTLVRGTAAGALGGGFAAFFPGVTGGVGGMLAGHATAQTEERAFLVSQGASKAVYYIGAFLLFFVPGAGLTRGGAAWMLRGLCPAGGYHEYRMALGSVALAAAVAFLAAAPLARGTIRLVQTHDYRRLSAVALLLMVALVASVTGLMGLLVMAVATGIGLIPVLFGSRRMNGLAVILLPLACNLSGVGATVAGWLGLL